MQFFELEPKDISDLNDADLRELVGRLCEAELIQQDIQPVCVSWGGAQEAPDGGLDVSVRNAPELTNPGFVPKPNTGFQVKKNSMPEKACSKEMVKGGKVKSVIADLAAQKGAYIIVSGADSCSEAMHERRLEGMAEAVKDVPDKASLKLDFYDSSRLSIWLRLHPGVALWARQCLGKPLSGWRPFGRWTDLPADLNDEFLQDDHPCVTDLNSRLKEPMPLVAGIEMTREKLRNPASTVRIIGLSGVGKTRFVQALFESKIGKGALPFADVVYADLGDDLSPSASELISYLAAKSFSSYVVLDNCPPDVHRKMQRQVAQGSTKLRLLTIEYDISDDKPEETAVIQIEPSSESMISQLVQNRFRDLGPVSANRIAEFAGGNARIAIALAGRVEVDETLTSFSDDDLFRRLFVQRRDPSERLLESAEVLSLVYSFNIAQTEYTDELSVLASLSGLRRRDLSWSQAELSRRHLVQKRDDWRAVLPHALANRLARRALESISTQEVNREILKPENLRMFQSCAHRLGYLHDFEPAHRLAGSWMDSGGPLEDILSCSEGLLTVLRHIAPIFPNRVLAAIERAITDSRFPSKENVNFYQLTSLLHDLTYEEERFEQTAELLLRLSEPKAPGGGANGVVQELRQLFSLYFSGTQAEPARRQAFIQRLVSGSQRHREIAEELLNSAFETTDWTGTGTPSFGARRRTFGWTPKTSQDRQEWYVGFVKLLRPALASENETFRIWAEGLLATHFCNLWLDANCFEILEEIVNEQTGARGWPAIWISIKETEERSIEEPEQRDGEGHSPEMLARLKALRELVAPSGFYAEMEAYVLTPSSRHMYAKGKGWDVQLKEIRRKATELGELAAAKPKRLQKLAPRLWKENVDSLWFFGEGLAEGSSNADELFDSLVELLQEGNFEVAGAQLFCGFIAAVHREDSNLAQKIQDRALRIPELKQHSVNLLTACPLSSWVLKKLLEVAQAGDLDALQFRKLACHLDESISDKEFEGLLSAISVQKNGLRVVFELLGMRISVGVGETSEYVPSEALRSAGRKYIRQLLLMERERPFAQSRVKEVVDKCLAESAPLDEIQSILDCLCKRAESAVGDINSKYIFRALLLNFPEVVLDQIFETSEGRSLLRSWYYWFKQDFPFNFVSAGRLVRWCDGDQKRIRRIASMVSVYSRSPNQPEEIQLSAHIRALLEVAEEKGEIIEIMAAAFASSVQVPIVEVLEQRYRAFAELLEHSSLEVQEAVKSKLPHLKNDIRHAKELEADMSKKDEQRFE